METGPFRRGLARLEVTRSSKDVFVVLDGLIAGAVQVRDGGFELGYAVLVLEDDQLRPQPPCSRRELHGLNDVAVEALGVDQHDRHASRGDPVPLEQGRHAHRRDRGLDVIVRDVEPLFGEVFGAGCQEFVPVERANLGDPALDCFPRPAVEARGRVHVAADAVEAARRRAADVLNFI